MALLKTRIGVGLLWLAVRITLVDASLWIGWTGMIGLILVLHFGTFHLLSILLRTLGIPAFPIMNAPLRAGSLSEFWGRCWNRPFNHLTVTYVFNPLARRLGATAAMTISFLLSGLIHELVITVPARGGYGLPTIYFAIQGLGLWLERSAPIRRHPWVNRVFAWAILVLPLGLLFPPVFINRIILPMLVALGDG